MSECECVRGRERVGECECVRGRERVGGWVSV